MKRYYDSDPSKFEGEYPTVRRLHDFCIAQVRQNRRALVYYFHNKGNRPTTWRMFIVTVTQVHAARGAQGMCISML